MSKITFLKEIKYSYQSCLLLKTRDIHGTIAPQATRSRGKQEYRRTDFGSRLLAAEGEGGGGQ